MVETNRGLKINNYHRRCMLFCIQSTCSQDFSGIRRYLPNHCTIRYHSCNLKEVGNLDFFYYVFIIKIMFSEDSTIFVRFHKNSKYYRKLCTLSCNFLTCIQSFFDIHHSVPNTHNVGFGLCTLVRVFFHLKRID